MDQFVHLFSSYWWLLFPLGFFVAQGWSSFMNYKRDKARIELLKSYAASGKEPPADLVASLNTRGKSPDWDDLDSHGGRRRHGSGSTTFLVVLFGGLSGIFAVAGYYGIIGGIGSELYFVSAILGVLALAFLFSGVAGRRSKDD